MFHTHGPTAVHTYEPTGVHGAHAVRWCAASDDARAGYLIELELGEVLQPLFPPDVCVWTPFIANAGNCLIYGLEVDQI